MAITAALSTRPGFPHSIATRSRIHLIEKPRRPRSIRPPGRVSARRKVELYCSYVGCLITSRGVAAALSISRDTAAQWLRFYESRGLLRITRMVRSNPGTSAPRVPMWEWVGD